VRFASSTTRPKHGSRLNFAEIEIAALTRQCLQRRAPDRDTLRQEVHAWQRRRNHERRTIECVSGWYWRS